jgi:CheY-like chemotaxis protein
MRELKLLLVDENPIQRETYAAALTALLEHTGVTVEAVEPLENKQDYLSVLSAKGIAALVLDQKLEDGGYSYTGSELAEYLRSVESKLPIMILTNYADDYPELELAERDVEHIASKEDIKDPDSEKAQVFKARLLRHMNVFADVRNTRQNRYHELLVKSLTSELSSDDQNEFDQAEEQTDNRSLAEVLVELRKLKEKL